MRLVDELLRLSATDLANHLGCLHLSQLNRAAAEGRAQRPKWNDPIGICCASAASSTRRRTSSTCARAALRIVEIDRDDRAGAEKTLAAMRAGADVIYQARLGGERWYGIADFLRKVERPSDLGAWSYEVTDAKLATETRAGTILQLCVYSELSPGCKERGPNRGARRRAAPRLQAGAVSARGLRGLLPPREAPARGRARGRARHLPRSRAAMRGLCVVDAVRSVASPR